MTDYVRRAFPTTGGPLFAPSLMCMDISNIAADLAVLNRHCDLLHVDVMDGHFVKNLALSLDFVRRIQPLTQLPTEVHLMVTDPEAYLDECAHSGAACISVHAETITRKAFRVMDTIKSLGCKAGVCLCPATPLQMIEAYLGEVDIVTVMTVDPGYAGSRFIAETLAKVAALASLRAASGSQYIIQCDGGVGPETYAGMRVAGADAYVMGTSGLFRGGDLEENCVNMKKDFATTTGETE